MEQREFGIEHFDDGTLLRVRDLKVSFRTDDGIITAVDGIDFEVVRGHTLGIVGESGSGKSVSVKAIMQLLPATGVIGAESSISFLRRNGDIAEITELDPTGSVMRQIRGDEITMVFQEPMASFSPVYTIGNQIIEAVREHRDMTKAEARALAIDMLERVGISNPSVRVDQYSFELSGGMRQRAMIALALATEPSLLIADEPTTALDVTIQAQILDLMRQLKDEFDMAIIFITHDLGVIAQIADDVAVMYLGHIIERGTTREIIRDPQHPYTRSLLKAIPRLDQLDQRLTPVGGDIPSPMARPGGCLFHTRCQQRIEGLCDQHVPGVTTISTTHSVSCFLYESVSSQ